VEGASVTSFAAGVGTGRESANGERISRESATAWRIRRILCQLTVCVAHCWSQCEASGRGNPVNLFMRESLSYRQVIVSTRSLRKFYLDVWHRE
jgi:hypothetical protein